MEVIEHLEQQSDSPVLTENAAANYLTLCPETLRKWRKKRKGPPWRRLGRRVVYLEEDLYRWVKAQSVRR